MLIDAVLTAVAYAVHWHRTRQPVQHEAAAEQDMLQRQSVRHSAAGRPVKESASAFTTYTSQRSWPGPRTQTLSWRA